MKRFFKYFLRITILLTSGLAALLRPGFGLVEAQGIAELEEIDNLRMVIPVGANQPPFNTLIMSVNITAQHPRDREQAPQISQANVAWGRDWCVLKIFSSYERDPIYRPPGTPGYQGIDYDRNSNLILWRTTEKYILSSKDRNETLEKQVMFVVSPEGELMDTSPYFMLWRFKVGDRNNLHLFDQLRMATGWGFATQLVEILSKEPDPANPDLMLVVARAQRGMLHGIWKLTLDKRNDWLARKAQFFPVELAQPGIISEVPYLMTTSSGVKETLGVKIAQAGSYQSTPFHLKFRVDDFEAVNLREGELHPLFKEVLERITAPLPPNSEIIDLRGGGAQRIPTAE